MPPPTSMLRLASLPAFQNRMYASSMEALACPRGDLVLTQNPQHGFVQNIAYEPSLLSYDVSYQNEQGLSPAFRTHLEEVLEKLGHHFAGGRIMEVGCGKGTFLTLLRQRGHDAWGIDPAFEGSDPRILRARFEPGIGFQADAIVLRHTLEHIADPVVFLASIRDANAGAGMIYIEVPCLDWILDHRAWFDLFYEHVNYFRLDDFHRIFGRVIESGHLFGGQYLYVFADIASLREEVLGIEPRPVVWPKDLFAGLDIAARSASSGKNIVWGAAAKGVMFTHHAQQRGVSLDFAIDINPAKQGMYLAGSGLPVLSPLDGLSRLDVGDNIFIMNSNYLEEVVAAGGKLFNYITVDRA